MDPNLHSCEFETHRLISRTPSSESYEASFLPSNEKVVLTIESSASEGSDLRWEIKVLKDLFGCSGVPRLVWEGEIEGRVAFAVKEYGQSLLSFVQKDSPMTLGVMLKVAVSMLKTLEAIHERGYLHLSVHPENIRLSQSGETLFLCGLRTVAINLVDGKTGRFKGDPVFASTGLLTGSRPCRKDDLESLSYVLTYAYTKTLPWALAQSADEVLAIRSRPAGMQLATNLPVEFHSFHSYVTSLDREKQPSYHTLRRRFRDASKRLNVPISLTDLWVRKKYSRRASEPFHMASLCPTATAPLPELSESAQTRIQYHHSLATGTKRASIALDNRPHDYYDDCREDESREDDCREDEDEDQEDLPKEMHPSDTVKKLQRPKLPTHLMFSRLTL